MQLALDSFVKPKKEDDEPSPEQTLILISSLLAWDETPKNLEEIRDPADVEEEERQRKADEAAAAKGGDDDVLSGDGADVVSGSGKGADDVVSGSGKAADDVLSGSGKAADDVRSGQDGEGVDGPMSDGDGIGEGEDGDGDQDA